MRLRRPAKVGHAVTKEEYRPLFIAAPKGLQR
jgi:hypothetical protein